jgi:hypothetical protein
VVSEFVKSRWSRPSDHVPGSQLVEGGQVDLLQRPTDRTLTECVDGVSRLRIDRDERGVELPVAYRPRRGQRRRLSRSPYLEALVSG